MKKTRALALLIAAGMSLSTTSAIISPTAGAATSPTGPVVTYTMAERYQPYYEPISVKSDSYVISEPQGAFPRGTKFDLRDKNWLSTRFEDGPFVSSVWSDGRVQVMQPSGTLYRYGDEGYQTNVRISVTYPDGSMEYISADVKVTSTDGRLSNISYPYTWVAPGGTEAVSPESESGREKIYNLVLGEDLDELLAQGWAFSLDNNTGILDVSAPSGATNPVEVPIQISFQDGSTTVRQVKLQPGHAPTPVPEPIPEPAPTAPIENRSFGSSSS